MRRTTNMCNSDSILFQQMLNEVMVYCWTWTTNK